MKYTVHQPSTKTSSRPPVLMILHGYGADEFDLLPVASELDSSFLSISIQAPIGLDWGGYAWYHLKQTSTGFQPDDLSRKQSEELLVNNLYSIITKEAGDPNHVYLMGFSQGAAMCYSLMGYYDLSENGLTIQAVIAMSGYVPEDVKEALGKKDLSRIPFFLSHGIHDELIPPIAMQQAKQILEEAGAKTFAKEYETGHGITEETVSDTRKWMDMLMHNA